MSNLIIQICDINILKCYKKSFYQIFRNNDPFGEMFQDIIVNRMILCPIDGFYLTEVQYEALLGAINTVQDKKINISEVESGADCFEAYENSDKYYCQHWKLDSDTPYKEYKEMKIIVENAIYSPKGKWGILISHEGHAVIGGTDEFMARFKALYPFCEDGINSFKRQWNYNRNEYKSDVDWIPKMINHIRNM